MKGVLMYYVGIDVSKLSVKVCIINETGETIKDPATYNLSRGGIFKLIDALSKINDKTNILIGMEATGSLWENILTSLSDEGYNVVLLNPHQTCKYRELQRRKAKTDAIDALVIAGLLRSGEYKRSYISSEVIQSLRDLEEVAERTCVALLRCLPIYFISFFKFCAVEAVRNFLLAPSNPLVFTFFNPLKVFTSPNVPSAIVFLNFIARLPYGVFNLSLMSSVISARFHLCTLRPVFEFVHLGLEGHSLQTPGIIFTLIEYCISYPQDIKIKIYLISNKS